MKLKKTTEGFGPWNPAWQSGAMIDVKDPNGTVLVAIWCGVCIEDQTKTVLIYLGGKGYDFVEEISVNDRHTFRLSADVYEISN